MASAVLVLSACSNETKENLGLVNTAPDEFAVVTRAPLSVPPDYALRPPMPGASRPMEMSTQQQARKTVFGESDVAPGGAYADNSGFLNKVGVQDADPNIRRVVDTEEAKDTRTTAERLLFMKGNKDKGEPLNPDEEMQRLRQEGVVKNTTPQNIPSE
tara:strand:- start:159 stop:632 length:474 start_codon:yes stop_codon:yes gene_type:complete